MKPFLHTFFINLFYFVLLQNINKLLHKMIVLSSFFSVRQQNHLNYHLHQHWAIIFYCLFQYTWVILTCFFIFAQTLITHSPQIFHLLIWYQFQLFEIVYSFSYEWFSLLVLSHFEVGQTLPIQCITPVFLESGCIRKEFVSDNVILFSFMCHCIIIQKIWTCR